MGLKKIIFQKVSIETTSHVLPYYCENIVINEKETQKSRIFSSIVLCLSLCLVSTINKNIKSSNLKFSRIIFLSRERHIGFGSLELFIDYMLMYPRILKICDVDLHLQSQIGLQNSKISKN